MSDPGSPEALIADLGQPELSTRLVIRLLDFLAAVLAGCGRRQSKVGIHDGFFHHLHHGFFPRRHR